MTSLFIGTPTHDGRMDLRWIRGVLGCQRRFPELAVQVVDGCFLPKLRDELTQLAITSGADYTLFVDSDQEWGVEHVERLMAHALPLVCGRYVDRKGFGIEMWTPASKADEGQRLRRALQTGAGFMLFRTAELRAFVETLDRSYLTTVGKTRVRAAWSANEIHGDVHEIDDAAFCRRWIASGREIVVDTECRIGHVGTVVRWPG